MKTFHCICGQKTFFENVHCIHCNRTLGFDSETMELHALDSVENNAGAGQYVDAKNNTPRAFCQNFTDFQVCNWLIPQGSNKLFCRACELNHMIPQVQELEKRRAWRYMEQAKRRLVFSLLRWQLPVESKSFSEFGMAFSFLEDKSSNPNVKEEKVFTGHADGLITVNLAEADDLSREKTRVELGESQRTLLGHFRHESGHYYFTRLVLNSGRLNQCREIFGDDREDYASALEKHYSGERLDADDPNYISYYASAHPSEDWAESWAHFLHISDTIATATDFGISSVNVYQSGTDEILDEWHRVSQILNGLNRSMGLKDAYPFVLSDAIKAKLAFVHQTISPTSATS